jgi:hypothetical protein
MTKYGMYGNGKCRLAPNGPSYEATPLLEPLALGSAHKCGSGKADDRYITIANGSGIVQGRAAFIKHPGLGPGGARSLAKARVQQRTKNRSLRFQPRPRQLESQKWREECPARKSREKGQRKSGQRPGPGSYSPSKNKENQENHAKKKTHLKHCGCACTVANRRRSISISVSVSEHGVVFRHGHGDHCFCLSYLDSLFLIAFVR